MAITNTWSVTDMQHTDADGGVFLVYWSMVAQSDGTPSFTATEGGKLRCEPDATSPTYTPYADLTEDVVLGWVYDSLVGEDETAAEAKARIEADRTAKVQKQIDAAAVTKSGTPWYVEDLTVSTP
jgi:predicted nucleic acid-binding Zn ribbon protein